MNMNFERESCMNKLISINCTLFFWLLVFSSISLSEILPDEFLLVMSKKDDVCQDMRKIFNKDLKENGELDIYRHAAFNSIVWEKPLDLLSGKEDLNDSLDQSRLSTFDINNDGVDETILINRFIHYGSLNQVDALYFFSQDDYPKKHQKSQIRELMQKKLNYQPDTVGDSRSYQLKELPVQYVRQSYKGTPYESDVDVDVYIYMGDVRYKVPFSYKGQFYIGLFRNYKNYFRPIEESDIVSIRQYQKDNSISDVCHYIKVD
jgi:hypothetical protein